MRLTKAQQKALLAVYQRTPLGISYLTFRRTVRPYVGGDCVMVSWQGMWLGIETDGYVHS